MGAGVRQDDEIALRYFQKAANLGDSYGTFMVGLHYYEGQGTRRNFKRAVDYFKRAQEMGDTRALYHLGICWPRHVSIWWRAMRNWSARLKLWSSASLPPSIRQKPIQSEAWRWQFVKPKKLPAGDGRKLFLTVRPTRYAHCGESPRGAAMMRNPRPEEQLRGGNKPWERKFEGKSRLYEQELHIRPDGRTRLQKVPKSDTSSRVHKVDADGAGGK